MYSANVRMVSPRRLSTPSFRSLMTASDELMATARSVETAATAIDADIDVAAVQRRTVRLLFATQVIGGVGVTVGSSVGALLAADIAGTSVSGLAQSATVVGAALLAVPATAIVQRRGRRPSLAACYCIAGIGASVI